MRWHKTVSALCWCMFALLLLTCCNEGCQFVVVFLHLDLLQSIGRGAAFRRVESYLLPPGKRHALAKARFRDVTCLGLCCVPRLYQSLT